jgi:hypothetical protein
MTAKVLSVPVTDDAIRARAYQIWEEEGRPEGRHELHWQRAMEWFASKADVPAKATPRAKASKAAKAKPNLKKKK